MQRLTDYIESHPSQQSRRLFLSIQTNATLITDERARWLKEKDIRVGISVDGKPESQNVSRPQVNGRESFSSLIRGIDALQRQGVAFGALVVLNRSNVRSVEDLAEFLLDNGIHGFRLNPVAYIGDARRNWSHVGLTQEEVIDYFQRLMKLIVERGYLLLEDNIHSMCDFITSKQRRTRCMRAECGAGDTFQSIAANGDIYPCGRSTQSPGLKLGNIFSDALVSLSTPAQSNPLIAQIRQRRPENLEDCPSCHYRQLCQSGCSAQAWERYGTVRHKTPECSFYKTLYPYLMHWLSFDGAAFEVLERSSYFNHEGMRFDCDFTATQPKIV
jgi:radical SAM protein with 4Fe4S-binding SPASM domain